MKMRSKTKIPFRILSGLIGLMLIFALAWPVLANEQPDNLPETAEGQSTDVPIETGKEEGNNEIADETEDEESDIVLYENELEEQEKSEIPETTEIITSNEPFVATTSLTVNTQASDTITTTVTLNGEPAPDGIIVYLFGANDTVIAEAMTKDGFVKFIDIADADGYYFVVAVNEDEIIYNDLDSGLFAWPTDNIPQIGLVTEARPLITKATLDGEPVSGVLVELNEIKEIFVDGDYSEYEIIQISSVITDIEGNACFDLILPTIKGSFYYFHVQKTDDYFAHTSDEFMFPSSVPNEIDLSAGHTVTSRVVDANGVPIEGIYVELRRSGIINDRNLLASATSGANGVVVFDQVPESKFDRYFLLVDDTKQPLDYAIYNSASFYGYFNLLEDTTRPNIVLEKGQSFSSTVRLNGVAAGNVNISLYRNSDHVSSGVRYASSKSDVNGKFSFDNIPAGSYHFYVGRSEGRHASYNGAKTAGGMFTVPGGTAPEIDLSIGETLRTRVTLNGVGLKGVDVILMGVDIPVGMGVSTEEDGLLVIENLPSAKQCYLEIECVDGQYANFNSYARWDGFFELGDTLPDIELEMGTPLTFQFTYNGTAAPKASFNLIQIILESDDWNEHIARIADSDAQGRLHLPNVAAGQEYYVIASVPKDVSNIKGDWVTYYGRDKMRFSVPHSGVINIEIAPQVLSVQAGSGGTVSTAGGKYQQGEKVTLKASPSANYKFSGWSSSNGGSFANANSATTTFTMPGSNATVTANFTYVQTGNNNNSNRGGGGGGGSRGGGGAATPTVQQVIASPLTTEQAVNGVKLAAASAKAAGQATAVYKVRNIGDVTLEALQATAKEAGMPVAIYADTLTADGKAVDMRVTLDPAQATKNMNLSASKANEKAQKTKAFFGKWFSNKMHVLSMGQTGSYGCNIEIAVLLDMNGFTLERLTYYSYDPATNTYRRVYPTKHWIDTNGYLHLVTDAADSLIISNGALLKK